MTKKDHTLANGTVMAFGTFDIIHPGHLSYLMQARRLGKKLIVVIARDATVKALKGHSPFFSEQERLTLVSSLKIVDRAVLGDKIHHCRIIDRLRPDIICLGYDQNITKQKLSEQLKRMHIPLHSIMRAKAYRKTRYKSTLIKKAFHGS